MSDGSVRSLARSSLHASVSYWLERLPEGRLPGATELDALAAQVPALPPGFGFEICDVPLAGADYERRIHATGRVPTRAGSLHDLFNALAWLSFPRLKQVLNRQHVAILEGSQYGREPAQGTAQGAIRGTGSSRGRVRDAVTLFDEQGLIVACDQPSLIELLAAHAWQRLFVDHRPAVVRHMRFLVCGHALLEHGLNPWKGLTARVLPLILPSGSIGATRPDELLAEADRLAAERLAPEGAPAQAATFLVLPVLGIPGWCADNDSPAFYADAAVFRPPRTHRAGGRATIGAEVGQTIAAAPGALGQPAAVEESPGSTGQDAG